MLRATHKRLDPVGVSTYQHLRLSAATVSLNVLSHTSWRTTWLMFHKEKNQHVIMFSGFEMQTGPRAVSYAYLISTSDASFNSVHKHLLLIFFYPITQPNAAVQPHKHLQHRCRWTHAALSPDFLLEHQHQMKEGRAPPPNASIKTSV